MSINAVRRVIGRGDSMDGENNKCKNQAAGKTVTE